MAEAYAVRTISSFGIPGKAIATAYTLYQFIESQVPAPELLEQGDPLPFDPTEAGWVTKFVGTHTPYPFGATSPGDPGSQWLQLGNATLYRNWYPPEDVTPTSTPISSLPSSDVDGQQDTAWVPGTSAILQTTVFDNDSPFWFEPHYFPTSAIYRPAGAPDPATRPDLWTGPTRTQITPVPIPGYETEWTAPRWNTATEVSYGLAPNPALNPMVDPPLYYGGTRPNTAVAIIRQPAPNVRPTQRPTQRRPRDIPKRHRMRSTKRYEREKKFIANVAASGALGKLVNFTTESVDAIDAIWDAVPDRLKTGYIRVTRKNWTTYEVMTVRGLEWHTAKQMPWDALYPTGRRDKVYNPNQMTWVPERLARPDEKARDIWKHWKEIDYDQAFWNLLLEQQNDQVYAKASPSSTKAGQSWLQATGRPVGFETGPAM